MTKKIILLFIFCTSFTIAKTQNQTIGVYTIFQYGDEYYLIHQTDTIWINSHVITIRFHDSISDSSKESFMDEYDLELKNQTIGNFNNYRIANTTNFINLCNTIYYDSRVDVFLFSLYFKLANNIPNDIDLSEQWYLDRLDVFEAWDLTVGSEDVIVAVIDDGLFLNHDDIGSDDEILENIFHNSGEDAWDYWFDPESGNNIDDDANDKIDDWKGWNFENYISIFPYYEQNNNVIPEFEWSFHGTAVSGIISAKRNNLMDVAGISGGDYNETKGGVKILPIKMFD